MSEMGLKDKETNGCLPEATSSKESCGCGNRQVILYSCAGGSNVGYGSYEAARRLVRAGKGKLACLAGVGGHVPVMVRTAQEAEVVVCIDGCGVACAKRALEHIDAQPDIHVIVTDMGIKKNYVLELKEEEVQKIVDKIEVELEKR
ncbi:MAG: putative zinc-binding protein [Methanomassiliicoccales archaeon]